MTRCKLLRPWLGNGVIDWEVSLMKVHLEANSSSRRRTLDGRLATYLTAAGAVGAVMATEAKAIVVGNNTVQPFGINGSVNIDFNSDGQTDFQIDHDRVTLPSGGP